MATRTIIEVNGRTYTDYYDIESSRRFCLILGWSLIILIFVFFIILHASLAFYLITVFLSLAALTVLLYAQFCLSSRAENYKSKFQKDLDWSKANCPAIQDLISTNEKYKSIFNLNLRPIEEFSWTYNSRDYYSMADVDEVFLRYAETHLDYIKGLIQAAEQNKKAVDEYEKEIAVLQKTIEVNLPNNIPMNKERYIDFSTFNFLQMKLKPATSVKVKVELEYVSPLAENTVSKTNGADGYNTDILKSIYVRLKGYNDLDERLVRPTPCISESDKQAIITRYHYTCSKCKKQMEFGKEFYLHHKRPYSIGAPSEPWNLILLCADCNSKSTEPEYSIPVML